jgi:hypothetical protein
MSQSIYLNGINGSTGQALDDFELTTELLARVARQQRLSQAELRDAKLRKAHNQRNSYQMGVGEGIDISDLARAGWGVIFPASLAAERVTALKDALRPLLDLRRAQAGRVHAGFYREFIGPELGYRAGESKDDFLRRLGRGGGAANPALGVPFYLLIVGSPEEIPFAFQYQLDVAYGVGRIYFDTPEDFAAYAQSVVRAERRQVTRPKRAVFLGSAHDDATRLSSRYLVTPLAEKIALAHGDWDVRVVSPDQSTKATLGELLGGAQTPAILFTANHGMGFNLKDPRLLPHTGALLCQDVTNCHESWIPERYYFSGDDIPATADVAGTLAFFFACYGAGSPRTDDFHYQAVGKERVIAPYNFLSRLPLKLLAHPRGGALGVFAHVDRAWSCSFLWGKGPAVEDLESFRSLLSALLKGKPAGAAGDYFGAHYGEISAQLNEERGHPSSDPQAEDRIAAWWTSNNDMRNYTFIGDPGVRLAVIV